MASPQISSKRECAVRGHELRDVGSSQGEAIRVARRGPTPDWYGVGTSDGIRSLYGSSRSMSSYTTQWSTITDPASNTSQRREENKNRKRRFLQFTGILMKLVQRSDPAVYRDAQALIHDCEQRKKLGEVQSATEILKRPLKDTVGPKYWRQAREYHKEEILRHVPQFDVEPLAVNEEPVELGEGDLSLLHDSLRDAESPTEVSRLHSASVARCVDEQKTRKKRIWMIICILMTHLKRTDMHLYLTAKTTVSDCVRRHRNKEEGYRSLSGSIQASLKDEIGSEYWRRAETYVANALLRQIEGGSTQNGSFHQSSSKKRTIDGVRVRFEKKRTRRLFET
jgi:hypothetical protein